MTAEERHEGRQSRRSAAVLVDETTYSLWRTACFDAQTAEDLAAASALSVATIRRAELKENQTALTSANDFALESAGVEFIDENGGGPGVRLRKREQKKGSRRE